jgi:phage terminase small subunit
VLRGEARAEWHRALDSLERMRILDQHDRALVGGYCTAWARLVKAESRTATLERRQQAAERRLARAKGNDARSLALSECGRLDRLVWKCEVSWSRAYNALIKAADRLGIGAAARARVHVEGGDEPDDMPTRPRPRLATGTTGD